MANLGVMYENGRAGLARDDAQAVAWYRRSAEAGGAAGMEFLAEAYENGQGGTPKDAAQAIVWYRKSAELGNIAAQAALKRLGQ
jgi:hypothetical protein